MSGTAVVLRPEPGNAATCAAARSLGLEAVAAPLFEIARVVWHAPAPARFDAVLFGSANALRCGGERLAALRSLPAYCVGAATADAARSAGFSISAVGKGGIASLVPALARDGRRRALRLAGEAHVDLDAGPGCRVETVVVYRALPLPLARPAAEALRAGAVALLHSAEAAGHFAGECDRLGQARETVALACMGPRIAEEAGTGWRAVHTAAEPNDAALLALARRMCQTAPSGVARQH